MHKQKKISLNILLTACLLLASLWGGVILNAIKNRSTAEATRWREFLYASQVDNCEANSYTYDDTNGWKYGYGTWKDNFANNISFTNWTSGGNVSFTKLSSSEDSTTYVVSDFDITTGKGSVDIASTDTTIKLYTKEDETGLYYNNALFVSDYTLNNTTEESDEDNTDVENSEESVVDEEGFTATSSPTITIGATSYTANVLGGTTDNPTYYIEYPIETLYVKYNANVNTPSSSNNYGFKLYLNDACRIEYMGSGSISDSSISYATNYTFSTPSNVRKVVEVFEVTELNNGSDIKTGKGSVDISSDNLTIKLYTKIGETGLYYNDALYKNNYTLNDTTEDDTEESPTATSSATITIGATSYTANIIDESADTPTYYIEYPTNTLYVKYDEANLGTDSEGNINARSSDNNYGFKLYLDNNCTIEYMGSGNYSDSSISYDTSYTYTFSDPDNGRMKWNAVSDLDASSDTKIYIKNDVTSPDNFAQNSQSNVVILDNYLNNLRAKNNTNFSTQMNYSDYLSNNNTYNINNFYVSFGRQVEKDDQNIIVDSDKIISTLTVTAYLNNGDINGLSSGASIDNNYGVRIKINDVTNYNNTNLSFSSNIGGLTNYYWYNYFDLTQIRYILNNNNSEPLLNTYGLYTIVFDYTVCDYVSNNIQNTKEQYVYQFYLTDDTNYVVYPTLNNSAQHLNEHYDSTGADYSTVYYNSKTYNLPTYVFDASKYNVSYSYTSTDDITTTYNTSFKLFEKSGESDKLGLLTINSTSYIIKLDSENKIWYYIGNESTTLSDDNLYGYIEIKKDADNNTGLYLHLNGIAKYNDGMLLKNVAKDTPVSYYFPIVLTELGEYTFENKYIIEKDSYNFDIIEPYTYGEGENAITIGLAKNIFKNYQCTNDYRHSDILKTMKYENGIYQFNNVSDITNLSTITKDAEESGAYYNNSKDGGYNLVFLGTKSAFMKNKTVTPFQDVSTGVYADITDSSWMDENGQTDEDGQKIDTILSDWETLTNLSYSWTKTETNATTGETKIVPAPKQYKVASQIPITNLSPVAFNLYGGIKGDESSIYYWKKNLTQNASKGGYFINGDDLTICGVPTKQNFTNGTSLERAGLYLIKVVVNYQGLSTDEATATQYFMFVIDNSDPEMYFYTGDLDENGVVPDENKLGMTTRYTNADDLKFYWDEPSYFQESVTALLEYSASYENKNFGTATNYVKGSIISSSAGSLTTAEGVYHLVVYYGQKPFFSTSDTDRSNHETTIYVDRTIPTASFYKYTSTSVNGEQIFSYSNTDSTLISNGKFRLYSDKTKASGAEITVKYSEINFNSNTNDADLIFIDGKSIVTTATYLDFVADNNITTQFYNLKSSAESIQNIEDDGQNLTLGSNNAATPSKLYIFTISDEAGNSATYYYIFDNSTPRVLYRQYNNENGKWEKADLDSTSISENTQVYWGNEKGIVLNVKENVKDEASSTEENIVYTTTYNTIRDAINYINEHTTQYKGFGQKNADSKNYLTLPITNVQVSDDLNTASTSLASQISIVTKANKDSFNTNSNWSIEWKDSQNNGKTISDFVSQNKTTYKSVITDCLGNKSITYSLYLDTDLANLTIFANEIKYKDDKVDPSQGTNSKSINANNATIYFKKAVADGIEAYVTYSYYPFAMASYFTTSSTNVFKAKNDYTVNNINGNQDTKLYITYPFSQEPLYKNQVLNSGDTLLSYTDDEIKMSQEGLYVLNRVYRYTENNQVLDQAQVENLSEDDIADINMYIVVDRQGIVSLVTDISGNVLQNESIGDLIYFKLGDGTDKMYEENISAGTLNILRQNKADSTSKKELFSTNRVKVTAFIPYDKYATALKLTDKFGIDTNTEHIQTATRQNNVLFGIYVSLLKASSDEKGETIYSPIILNNSITEIGQAIIDKTKTQQSFETISNTDGLSLNHLLSMVQSGTYRLYLTDKKLEETSANYNTVCQLSSNSTTTYYSDGQYSNTHYFDYIIEHKLPSGKYTSQSSELELASGQNYKSINKNALSFEFEDYANIYDAKIDPNHFTVSRRVSGSATEEVILKRENGIYTTKPANMTDEFIAENIFIKSILQKDLKKYTLNIFNEENNLLSDRYADYIYQVTIYYVGEESFYNTTNQKTNGDYEIKNYYKATYSIHQDTTAPSQNLNKLIDIAQSYAGEIDIDTYFFAVDRYNTGLTSNDTDESNQIYLRKIESLDDFKPSLLPGDNNFAGLTSSAPSFNPNSVDSSIYKSAWSYSYDPNNPTNTISFSSQEKGYYELLELDTAQNITRYFVYLNDESSLYVNLNYNLKVNESKDDALNSVNYDSFYAENFDINPTLNLATLNLIESFIVDDDQLIKDNNKALTSSKDYYSITQDKNTYTYYFDKFVIAYIKDSNGSTIQTIVCDAFNESLKTFYTRVVEAFNNIQEQKTAFNYSIEILNRFGENYIATLKLPDAELSLKITDKTDYFEVVVPAQSGNVFLTSFTPKRASGGTQEELSNDNADNTIKKSDIKGLQAATYKFGKGDYEFTIVDNYGRVSVVYKFFGSDTDDKYVVDFGDNYITGSDKDYDEIVYTNQNVTLNINNSLWDVKCYFGDSLSALKANIADGTLATKSENFEISGRTDSRGKYTYTFSKVGYYYLETNRTFAKQDSNNGETFIFCIDKTLPKAYAVFDSGTQRELTNDSYSENITIVWESKYDITGTLKHISSEGVSTTYSITKDTIEYYVNVNGSYELTLTDAISNTCTWKFEKIKSSYAYFTIHAEGIDKPLQESKYTEVEEKTIIQYYYVKYSGETTPEITIMPDSSKGISSQETDNSNDYMKEYEIISSNTLSSDPSKYYVICKVRIVFVEETDDFANMKIFEVIDKDGNDVSNDITQNMDNTYTSYAKQLKLTFNSTHKSEDITDSDIYNGNTIYLLHYFNGELIRQYNGVINEDNMVEIDITRSGLHKFEIRDLCGNVQKWNNQDHYDLYVVNSVIYTLNDQNPIPNSFYNDEVKLHVVDKLGDDNNVLYTYVGTAMLNGKQLAEFEFDSNGDYSFNTPGYYIITITATTPNSTELIETIGFTIINQNVAMIAFNIPTSYGFTIESIYKNQANMTNSISNRSTLWLAAGDEVFGSGVFTINASYFDSSLSTKYYFSFKVWINEETPTILPVDYTYGTKTSKAITLQYNGAVIYSQIGLGYIRITTSSGKTVSEYAINEESANEVTNLTINSSGEYIVALYNNEGKLVSSYKVIKTKPLNSSAKIIIIIAVSVVVALTGVFIFLRKRLRFR